VPLRVALSYLSQRRAPEQLRVFAGGNFASDWRGLSLGIGRIAMLSGSGNRFGFIGFMLNPWVECYLLLFTVGTRQAEEESYSFTRPQTADPKAKDVLCWCVPKAKRVLAHTQKFIAKTRRPLTRGGR
jgi:hypothetical protein